jgi:DNA-binding transcriptional LysR family regulator
VLGVQLLERTSRVVSPTVAGDVFAEEARKVLFAVDAAVVRARQAASDLGTFKIGCSPYVTIESLLEFLGALDARLPDLRMDVTHTPATDQVTSLRRGELAVGIIPNAGAWEEVLLEPLFPSQPLAGFVRADHPLGTKKHLRPLDVEGEMLVLFPRPANPALHDRIRGQLSETGYRFAGVREAGGLSARDFVLSVLGGGGIAVSTFSHREVSEAGKTVVRLPLSPVVYGPEFALAWRAEPPQQLRPFVEAAREVARALRRRSD